MKKSEYLDFLVNSYGFTEIQAHEAAATSEQAGVRWEPEIQEIPERLEPCEVDDIWTLQPEGVAWVNSRKYPPKLEEPTCREAAARHNAMGRILMLVSGARDRLHHSVIKEILTEERNRLR